MDTLYDLLGALPRDDAEGLRTAFRRAVKGTHPDLNPHDPDAGVKFRQIVRAQEILLDGEQRAAYDHLLELARVEAGEHARAGRIHRLASWVMALAGLSAVSIGCLALVALMWTRTEPTADTDFAGDDAAAVQLAAVAEPTATSPAEPAAPAEPTATAPAAPAETADSVLPPLGPPIDLSPPPGVVELDGSHGVDRPFADSSHAKRPDKAARSATAKKKGPGAAEGGAKPTPQRRTEQIDPSRQESFPFKPHP